MKDLDAALLERAGQSLERIRTEFDARYLRNVEPGGIGCFLTDDGKNGEILCPACGVKANLPMADSRSVAWLIADSEEWETRCSRCDVLMVRGEV